MIYYYEIEPYIVTFENYLRQRPDITHIAIAGAYRRHVASLTAIDCLIASTLPTEALIHLIKESHLVHHIIAKTEDLLVMSLNLFNIPLVLHRVPTQHWGAMLYYKTATDSHWQTVKAHAEQRGMLLDGRGLWQNDTVVATPTEERFIRTLDLPTIPPELREGNGEWEAALNKALPEPLITLEQLQGSLHNHTDWSDGSHTIKAMAIAAKGRGHTYLGITDHATIIPSVCSMNARKLEQQADEIDQLNKELQGIQLLKGVEVDILEDGSLYLPDSVLALMDYVVVSIHTDYELSKQQQTTRLLRALEHSYCSILAHPTGRIGYDQPGYPVDLLEVIEGVKARGCFIELNANPRRLDLDEKHCRIACEKGVLISLNADAHSISGLDNLYYGTWTARRGWLTPKDILNTKPLEALLPELNRTMGRS